jgi:hypothetical protein
MYHFGLESHGELYMNTGEWDQNNFSYTCFRNTLSNSTLHFTALCNVVVQSCLLLQSTDLYVPSRPGVGGQLTRGIMSQAYQTKKEANIVIRAR